MSSLYGNSLVEVSTIVFDQNAKFTTNTSTASSMDRHNTPQKTAEGSKECRVQLYDPNKLHGQPVASYVV